MESENARRVVWNFLFLCRKIGSINGFFCRCIIKSSTTPVTNTTNECQEVDFQMYIRITLAICYVVDKHDMKRLYMLYMYV